MAGPCACRSSYQNPPPTGKDELTEFAPTEGGGTFTPTRAVSDASTPYSVIVIARFHTC